MSDLIIMYLAGMLTASGAIIIWNFSYISLHFLSFLFKDKDLVTVDDLADAIAENHPTLSELLFCPVCLGFWLSLGISSIICYLNNFNYWFIPICGFSWPLFIFLFYKHIESK